MKIDNEIKSVRKKLAAVDDALIYMSKRDKVLEDRIDCIRSLINRNTEATLWTMYDELVCEKDMVSNVRTILLKDSNELCNKLKELQKGETW